MEYIRINDIGNPLFAQMHRMMQNIFFRRRKCWNSAYGKSRWKIPEFGCLLLCMKEKWWGRRSTAIMKIPIPL